MSLQLLIDIDTGRTVRSNETCPACHAYMNKVSYQTRSADEAIKVVTVCPRCPLPVPKIKPLKYLDGEVSYIQPSGVQRSRFSRETVTAVEFARTTLLEVDIQIDNMVRFEPLYTQAYPLSLAAGQLYDMKLQCTVPVIENVTKPGIGCYVRTVSNIPICPLIRLCTYAIYRT